MENKLVKRMEVKKLTKQVDTLTKQLEIAKRVSNVTHFYISEKLCHLIDLKSIEILDIT